uniref:Uncharacterized protein n=1 Tax=Rhodosorus marinus TaxID=101924 RepID=A0A7S2ZVY4_9RHOD|mmetsp:Transcript_34823/g.137394  ORF Transcript_34823/g.137394 Transcript_34823/m.137394 type:complete len:1270 (+) Transcript_34823:245-4054(+)
MFRSIIPEISFSKGSETSLLSKGEPMTAWELKGVHRGIFSLVEPKSGKLRKKHRVIPPKDVKKWLQSVVRFKRRNASAQPDAAVESTTVRSVSETSKAFEVADQAKRVPTAAPQATPASRQVPTASPPASNAPTGAIVGGVLGAAAVGGGTAVVASNLRSKHEAEDESPADADELGASAEPVEAQELSMAEEPITAPEEDSGAVAAGVLGGAALAGTAAVLVGSELNSEGERENAANAELEEAGASVGPVDPQEPAAISKSVEEPGQEMVGSQGLDAGIVGATGLATGAAAAAAMTLEGDEDEAAAEHKADESSMPEGSQLDCTQMSGDAGDTLSTAKGVDGVGLAAAAPAIALGAVSEEEESYIEEIVETYSTDGDDVLAFEEEANSGERVSNSENTPHGTQLSSENAGSTNAGAETAVTGGTAVAAAAAAAAAGVTAVGAIVGEREGAEADGGEQPNQLEEQLTDEGNNMSPNLKESGEKVGEDLNWSETANHAADHEPPADLDSSAVGAVLAAGAAGFGAVVGGSLIAAETAPGTETEKEALAGTESQADRTLSEVSGLDAEKSILEEGNTNAVAGVLAGAGAGIAVSELTAEDTLRKHETSAHDSSVVMEDTSAVMDDSPASAHIESTVEEEGVDTDSEAVNAVVPAAETAAADAGLDALAEKFKQSREEIESINTNGQGTMLQDESNIAANGAFAAVPVAAVAGAAVGSESAGKNLRTVVEYDTQDESASQASARSASAAIISASVVKNNAAKVPAPSRKMGKVAGFFAFIVCFAAGFGVIGLILIGHFAMTYNHLCHGSLIGHADRVAWRGDFDSYQLPELTDVQREKCFTQVEPADLEISEAGPATVKDVVVSNVHFDADETPRKDTVSHSILSDVTHHGTHQSNGRQILKSVVHSTTYEGQSRIEKLLVKNSMLYRTVFASGTIIHKPSILSSLIGRVSCMESAVISSPKIWKSTIRDVEISGRAAVSRGSVKSSDIIDTRALGPVAIDGMSLSSSSVVGLAVGGDLTVDKTSISSSSVEKVYLLQSLFLSKSSISKCKINELEVLDSTFLDNVAVSKSEVKNVTFKENLKLDTVPVSGSTLSEVIAKRSVQMRGVTISDSALELFTVGESATLSKTSIHRGTLMKNLFQGRVDAEGIVIVDSVLEDVLFGDIAHFNSGSFRGSKIKSVAFLGPVSFAHSKFKDVWFEDVTFGGPVSFDGTKFSGTTFANCVFKDAVDFGSADAKDTVFSKTRFEANIDYDPSSGMRDLWLKPVSVRIFNS